MANTSSISLPLCSSRGTEASYKQMGEGGIYEKKKNISAPNCCGEKFRVAKFEEKIQLSDTLHCISVRPLFPHCFLV